VSYFNERKIRINNGFVVVPAIALVIGGVVGCSSGTASKPKPETLPSGTAQLTIDHTSAETTTAVHCSTVDSTTTITTGDDDRGATVMVSNAGPLTVKFVRIRKLSGVTGDYNLGLAGDATIAMYDATYDITGAVLGYSPKTIAPTTQPFRIKVSC
jgi:lipoprotein LpqH